MYKHVAKNKIRSVLLLMISIAIIIALGYVIGSVYGYSYEGLTIAILIALGLNLLSYFAGDKIALWSTGAKPVTKEEIPYVYNLVENLCITSGMPLPKIYVIDDQTLNAFATGRKPELASIALTRGIIEKLENEELEGVIAHELSHIKNYDIRFMMIVVISVGVITLLANFFIRGRLFGFGRSRDRNSGQIGAILMVIGIVLAILSPLIGELIKLAVSRKREYLADASGALLTRYPEGLAKALEKISQFNTSSLAGASQATAHLFIANPFGNRARGLFSTHPPVEKRVQALRQMATNK